MKKILVLLSGGTVCSAADENGVLSVTKEGGAALVEGFKKSRACFDVTFDVTENLFILSENMTFEGWNSIFSLYRKKTLESNYDGVIIAHGTDTLGYTASLFSLLLSKTDVPVFFVSSNAPLSSKRANGNDNFKSALDCIVNGISPNVYVCYKNISNGKMMLHLASRLKQCASYTEDFESAGEIDISDISKAVIEEINERFPSEKRKEILIPNGFSFKRKVLFILPYPEIDYSAFDLSRFGAVLHGCYHSGTANANGNGVSSVNCLLSRCREKGIPFYFAPAKESGEIYLSAKTVSESGNATFLYGATAELYYSKLTLALSLFEKNEDIYNFMTTEFNFENGYL